MASNKTRETQDSVASFIETVENEQKRAESLRLVALMKEVTGFEARMWGPAIVGFGSYHYRYDSGHEGDAPLVGFSPRKAAFSLYVFTGLDEHRHLLEGLGKFTMGKACIYVKKLSDINQDQLQVLMRETIGYLRSKYGSQPA